MFDKTTELIVESGIDWTCAGILSGLFSFVLLTISLNKIVEHEKKHLSARHTLLRTTYLLNSLDSTAEHKEHSGLAMTRGAVYQDCNCQLVVSQKQCVGANVKSLIFT